MANEIRKPFAVGETVYRKWRHTGSEEEYWYEPYHVIKVTAGQVHVRTLDACTIILKRRELEHWGHAIHRGLGAVFYTDMPEEYRKRTLGYVMDKGPREVLGLPDFFTAEQLQAAYHDKSLATHPDRGGSAEAFARVNAAYEHLKSGIDFVDPVARSRGS